MKQQKQTYCDRMSYKNWRKAKLDRNLALAIGRAKAWSYNKRRAILADRADKKEGR